MKFEGTIIKIGSTSNGVTIPKALLKALGYNTGDKIIIKIEQKENN